MTYNTTFTQWDGDLIYTLTHDELKLLKTEYLDDSRYDNDKDIELSEFSTSGMFASCVNYPSNV
jgi:hypothetical protein